MINRNIRLTVQDSTILTKSRWLTQQTRRKCFHLTSFRLRKGHTGGSGKVVQIGVKRLPKATREPVPAPKPRAKGRIIGYIYRIYVRAPWGHSWLVRIQTFLQYHRKKIMFYLAGSILWTGLWAAYRIYDYEVVPITGRKRNRGSNHGNARIDEALREERGEGIHSVHRQAVGKIFTIQNGSLPHYDPRYIRATAVLDRLLVSSGLDSLPWGLEIIKDPNPKTTIVDDTCLMCISTSLLNATRSDHELAAALAHELGHFIACHNRETIHEMRLSFLQFIPWAPVALPGALMACAGALLTEAVLFVPGLIMLCIPVAPSVGYSVLKSRAREFEADYIALLLMTHAGYKPKSAIPPPQSVGELGLLLMTHGGYKRKIQPPVWLQAHPFAEARIKSIRTDIPKVRTIVNQVNGKSAVGEWAPMSVEAEKAIKRWEEFLATAAERKPA